MFPSAYNTIAYAASITSGSDIITCRIRKLQPLTVSPTYVGQIGIYSLRHHKHFETKEGTRQKNLTRAITS
eukprot:8793053-Pyramimonas_sp.AAC.2